MSAFKELGDELGKLTGQLLGGTVRVAGALVNSEYIKEIGDSVEAVTQKTGRIVGQTASGIFDVGAGVLQGDVERIDRGFGDVGDAVVTTGKDLVNGIKFTGESIGHTANGLFNDDPTQVKEGLKNLGKAAVVSLIGYGVIDAVVDSNDVLQHEEIAVAAEAEYEVNASPQLAALTVDPYTGAPDVSYSAELTLPSAEQVSIHEQDVVSITTINDSLDGELHPVTGVPYESHSFILPDGSAIEGVFPSFDSVASYQLPDDMYYSSDAVHNAYMNSLLSNEVATNAQFAEQFTTEQLEDIYLGHTPSGYTWHHSQYPGIMELVDQENHSMSAHTGGRELWGGGEEYR